MNHLSKAILVLGFIAGLSAAEELVFDDPKKAAAEDPDFALQGEFIGTHKEEDVLRPYGAQIIALGNGTFRGVGFPGGLPGQGWAGDEPSREDGRRDAMRVVFGKESELAILNNDRIVLLGADATWSDLKRVQRSSPTLGAKPPAVATVLFDATQASLEKHWQVGARMTNDGLLMEGAVTRQEFGDFALHLEFRVPYGPAASGQGRGNSGVYIHNRYEVQILDSFGLAAQANECGGLYKFRAPDVNMSYPPLVWQTYDIDFTAAGFDGQGTRTTKAKVTIRHNGVVIHQDVELSGGTGAGASRPEVPQGPIVLQEHGNPVRFRNVWIVQK